VAFGFRDSGTPHIYGPWCLCWHSHSKIRAYGSSAKCCYSSGTTDVKAASVIPNNGSPAGHLNGSLVSTTLLLKSTLDMYYHHWR
jgi:hypothetical protein